MPVFSQESIEAFLKEHADSVNTLAASSGDKDAWMAHANKFYKDNAMFIRPSGNPMDPNVYVDMMASGDVTIASDKLLSVDDFRVIADNKVAVVLFKQDQIFNYKGQPNEDRATFSAVLEAVDDDGTIKLAHMHRCTGQPIPKEE